MLNVNSPLFIAMATVFATAALALFVWSIQRIIIRIDAIREDIALMGNRLAVVETKQTTGVELAARADKVARKTATKVGVRLPRELTDTIDPRRVARP